MNRPPRKTGLAHAARLERFIQRRRALAKGRADGAGLTPSRLTFRQKTASHPRLSRTCVAQAPQFLTVQENNHARLL